MEYYVDNKVAAVSVFSIVGLCPPLTEINVTVKKKICKGFKMPVDLFEGLKELCDMI